MPPGLAMIMKEVFKVIIFVKSCGAVNSILFAELSDPENIQFNKFYSMLKRGGCRDKSFYNTP